METDRSWMYNRLDANGRLLPEFIKGVKEFVDIATSKPLVVTVHSGKQCIPCPCKKCENFCAKDLQTVRIHLYKSGFRDGYELWHTHGEERPNSSLNAPTRPNHEPSEPNYNAGIDMVMASAGQNFDWEEERPTGMAKKFFDMLAASKTPLWEENMTGQLKCESHTILSAVTQAIALKSEHQLSQKCFDGMMSLIKSMLPPSEKLPKNFYQAKRLIDALGMEHKKIDVCPNFCMLYYNDANKNKTRCDECGTPRYKPPGPNKNAKPVPQKILRYLPITPRLQKMYMTQSNAVKMRWHKEGFREKPGIMVHPADGEAWKHFARKYPKFAAEVRNVWLGITTDGFMPFNSNASPYSCWPVFVFLYNLPPGMIMKEESMFLTLVIPGPKHPGRDIDILLEPLIDELNKLWNVGELTWDVSKQHNFTMHASLLWSVCDYPAYEMLCGWGTKGRLACFHCMGATKAFQLKHGGKATWFGCHRCLLPLDHPFRRDKKNFIKGKVDFDRPPRRVTGEERLAMVSKLGPIKWGKKNSLQQLDGYGDNHHWQKKSIFWSLPYWKDNLLQHSIDMMHLEKNFAENLIYTVLGIGTKNKDNEKARRDLALLCDRDNQNLIPDPGNPGKLRKPKAPFTLSPENKKKVLIWLKDHVKFPDGFASNWARSVNLTTNTLTGLKSHDLHVFMERLLPIAFRDFVPDYVWDVLCEISSFFREICAKELDPSRINQLEKDIVVTMCKMEKIFPPGFFDSMEHLVVHVCHEARLGGPVGPRWMYPCERRNKEQRMRVTNKARVEGSIVEATVVKEIGTFCTLYFAENSINNPQGVDTSDPPRRRLSIFDTAGRFFTQPNRRTLDQREYKAAHTYVILNCPEIKDKFLGEFDACMLNSEQATNAQHLDKVREDGFADWLRKKVLSDHNCDRYLRRVGLMPQAQADCFEGYEVNGFRFHTEEYGGNKSTKSSGVCIKGEWDGNDTPQDYYGILQEVIELDYDGLNKVVLFKCNWFDITNGVRVDKQHGIVEVKHASRLKNYEPFVLAPQAIQVFYLPYPSDKIERRQWWVAMKNTAKGRFRVDDDVHAYLEFFQDEMPDHSIEVSNGEGFDWDGMAPQDNEFELVEDTMSQGVEEFEGNPIEIEDEDDEGLDMEHDEDEFGF